MTVFNSPLFADNLCTRIEDHLEISFQAFDLEFETAVQSHVSHIKTLRIQWDLIRSHRTCLLCLRRKPEHILTCRHAICDTCAAIFENPLRGKEAHFVVDPCALCGTKGRLVVKLKPSTAGARILTIDGGGVRGVVPLEFLRLLQNLLEPQLPLQDLFEQAFGTSSGSISFP